jgi:hypothetical protein
LRCINRRNRPFLVWFELFKLTLRPKKKKKNKKSLYLSWDQSCHHRQRTSGDSKVKQVVECHLGHKRKVFFLSHGLHDLHEFHFLLKFKLKNNEKKMKKQLFWWSRGRTRKTKPEKHKYKNYLQTKIFMAYFNS